MSNQDKTPWNEFPDVTPDNQIFTVTGQVYCAFHNETLQADIDTLRPLLAKVGFVLLATKAELARPRQRWTHRRVEREEILDGIKRAHGMTIPQFTEAFYRMEPWVPAAKQAATAKARGTISRLLTDGQIIKVINADGRMMVFVPDDPQIEVVQAERRRQRERPFPTTSS